MTAQQIQNSQELSRKITQKEHEILIRAELDGYNILEIIERHGRLLRRVAALSLIRQGLV